MFSGGIRNLCGLRLCRRCSTMLGCHIGLRLDSWVSRLSSAMRRLGSGGTDWRRLFLSLNPYRPVVAVDETKLKRNGEQLYIWAAMDVQAREILAFRVSWARSSLDALVFHQDVLKLCTNKPLILVDKGPWYPWPLVQLGLPYRHVTFGMRNRIERWFGKLKARTKRFPNNFPYGSTLEHTGLPLSPHRPIQLSHSHNPNREYRELQYTYLPLKYAWPMLTLQPSQQTPTTHMRPPFKPQHVNPNVNQEPLKENQSQISS